MDRLAPGRASSSVSLSYILNPRLKPRANSWVHTGRRAPGRASRASRSPNLASKSASNCATRRCTAAPSPAPAAAPRHTRRQLPRLAVSRQMCAPLHSSNTATTSCRGRDASALPLRDTPGPKCHAAESDERIAAPFNLAPSHAHNSALAVLLHRPATCSSPERRHASSCPL